MKVKMQVLELRDHKKGGILVLRTQYNERLSKFVFSDLMPQVEEKFTVQSVHVLDVRPDVNSKGQPDFEIDLGLDGEEITF